jgi:DNA polymerase (family 10)
MTNAQIADIFDEIADLLEFQAANPFRVRAYRNGARAVRDLHEPLETLVQTGEQNLTKIAGIGKDLAAKCMALIETGKIEMLDDLRAEVPESVLALLRIPGLGPKKAAALHKQLGINSLDELRQACQQQQVRVLKGFAAKTEELILKGIDFATATTQEVRLYWADADEIARQLLAFLKSCSAVERMEVAGSYRRGKETVGDLDLLVVARQADEVMDRLAEFPRLKEQLLRGGTKMSVRLDNGLQVDLRVVPAESFGAALQYFTGSKEHNVVVRSRAKQLGLKINEWGVFRIEDGRETYVAGATEQEVYATLDLPLFPPELREARQEFAWAKAGKLPTLIAADDIRGDLHMHTHATDGKASIREMADAARQRGLQYIAITDHSKRVSMANGLNAERLLAQWEEVDRIDREMGKNFHILKGIECDILEKGGLDLPDDVLQQADWVVASVHYGQKQPAEQITARIVEALRNPHVSAIAHPTGRLINRREPYAVDLDRVMEVAAEEKKMLELNANPARLDLNDLHCAMAKQRGIPIVISTDAHSVDGLDVMRYGILQARRAGLEKADVANSRPFAQFVKLLRGRKAD